MDTENQGAARGGGPTPRPIGGRAHGPRGAPGLAGLCTWVSWPSLRRHLGPYNSSTSTTPSMPTWGWSSQAWSLFTWHSAATGSLGCSHGSGAPADGSRASYVSWRRMGFSPSSRSTSWFLGSSTGIGDTHWRCPSSRNRSTGGTCSPLSCSSCTWQSTSRAGGGASDDPRSDSPMEHVRHVGSALSRRRNRKTIVSQRWPRTESLADLLNVTLAKRPLNEERRQTSVNSTACLPYLRCDRLGCVPRAGSPIWVIIADLRTQLGRPTRPASSQPTVVPDSKPAGMAEPFFSALNSSVAWALFHSTESPALV